MKNDLENEVNIKSYNTTTGFEHTTFKPDRAPCPLDYGDDSG